MTRLTNLPQILIILLLSFIWSTLACANSEPKIVNIAGKAEIMAQGQWSRAQTGQTLSPGQSVRVVGPGEVALSTEDGQIQLTGQDDSVIRYDGDVDVLSQPWQSSLETSEEPISLPDTSKIQPQYTLPLGEVKIKVVPDQPFRVVTPLITAAVRGTQFSVKIAQDGTSKVHTQSGRVDLYGRNGQKTVATTGISLEITSLDYTEFLKSHGVNIPKDQSWQGVAPEVLSNFDRQLFGDVFTEDKPKSINTTKPKK